jgi:hypothetical protein
MMDDGFVYHHFQNYSFLPAYLQVLIVKLSKIRLILNVTIMNRQSH